MWDLTIPSGVRLPAHQHLYDYAFHVLEASTLAVFSGEDGGFMFQVSRELHTGMHACNILHNRHAH